MANNEETTNYKVNEQSIKNVDEIMSRDKDDESLRKWKESLLGNALSEQVAPKNDPRRVVIKQMSILINEDNNTTEKYSYSLDSTELLEKLKNTPFVLREGCLYRLRVSFKIQHELVTGLKFVNTVYRKGVRVEKEETMIGSFGPSADNYTVEVPRKEWNEAPSGLLARGRYKAHVKFVDDDNQTYLEYDYTFSIKKDWSNDTQDEE